MIFIRFFIKRSHRLSSKTFFIDIVGKLAIELEILEDVLRVIPISAILF